MMRHNCLDIILFQMFKQCEQINSETICTMDVDNIWFDFFDIIQQSSGRSTKTLILIPAKHRKTRVNSSFSQCTETISIRKFASRYCWVSKTILPVLPTLYTQFINRTFMIKFFLFVYFIIMSSCNKGVYTPSFASKMIVPFSRTSSECH